MSEIVTEDEQPKLTKKDFVSSADVRWCPRCGDYAILSAVQKVFPELGIPREDFVIVSGIGCSSRFPYYMNTYGFHTIHGRAPAIATGVKVANPKLSVWVVTGDGDGLSIGGNHLMHALRRNLDITILLFNNRIYGLTKGQYSPTSEQGKRTKTSPMGSIDYPINPLCFAIAAEATFVARAIDTNPKHMAQVLKAASEHKGVSFVEIFQNCVIFNDATFEDISGRDVRDDRLLMLEQGKPLIYGKDRDKGIRLNGLRPELVTIGENGITEKDLIVHDENDPDPSYAYLLTQMQYPDFPTPMGVFRSVENKLTYDEQLQGQMDAAVAQKGPGHLQMLVNGAEFWEVDATGSEITGSLNSKLTHSSDDNLETSVAEERSKRSHHLRAHPLFSIIRRTFKDVIDVCGMQTLVVQSTQSVEEAIAFFKETGASALMVYQDKKYIGILSERDIMWNVALKDLDRKEATVKDIMLNPDPKIFEEKMMIGTAINRMALGGSRHVVVNYQGTTTLISIKEILAFIRGELKGA